MEPEPSNESLPKRTDGQLVKAVAFLKEKRGPLVGGTTIVLAVGVGYLALSQTAASQAVTAPKDYVSLFLAFTAMCISAGNAYLSYRDRNKDHRGEFYKQRNAALTAMTAAMFNINIEFNYVYNNLENRKRDGAVTHYKKLTPLIEAQVSVLNGALFTGVIHMFSWLTMPSTFHRRSTCKSANG